jgi:hypothetical protein
MTCSQRPARAAALLAAAALAVAASGWAVAALAAPPPAAGAGGGAAARTFAVRLTRTAAVGDKQLAVGSLETDDQSSGGPTGAEPTKRHDKVAIRFVVATEVQEVSPRGYARRAVLTVRRLNRESGGVTTELAKPGEVFTARMLGHDRLVEQGGTPVSPELQQALAVAVPLRSDDEPTDDDLYGSGEPHRVGDKWAVPAALFATSGAQRVVFEPAQVSGTVTLAGEKAVHGQPCLEVQWNVLAHRGSFKPGALPGGLLGTLGTMTVSGSLVVPVDPKLAAVSRHTVIAAVGDFTGTTEDGAALTLHRDLRQTFQVELSKIP